MAEQEKEMDRDFDFSINLSGITAPTGQKNVDVPEGYYKAVVTDMYVNPERNANRVIFKLTISEGPFSGVIRTHGLNKPKDGEDNVRYYWRGVSESCGYSPTALDAGEIEIGRTSFVDKVAHIHFVPKSDDSQWEKVDFLAPTVWNQQKQVFDASRHSMPTGEKGSALGSNGSKGPVTSSSTTSKSEVLAKLGL